MYILRPDLSDNCRFWAGIIASFPNAVVARLSKDSNVGIRTGFLWSSVAFAELIGAAIAGRLIKRTGQGQHDDD